MGDGLAALIYLYGVSLSRNTISDIEQLQPKDLDEIEASPFQSVPLKAYECAEAVGWLAQHGQSPSIFRFETIRTRKSLILRRV